METTIYFVRHGKVYNPQHLLYERLPNFYLSEEGIQQAKNAAKELINKHIDFLYASPLLRAQQTAQIIQQALHIPSIETSDNLLEVKSYYAGQPMLSSEEMNYILYESPERKPETDESIEGIADRMLAFIDDMVKEHTGKTIVAVTHGDPIMILYAALKKYPLQVDLFEKSPYIATGGILKVVIDEADKRTTNFL